MVKDEELARLAKKRVKEGASSGNVYSDWEVRTKDVVVLVFS